MRCLGLLLLMLGVFGGGVACDTERAAPSEHATADWALTVREAHTLADSAQSEAERRAATSALRHAIQRAPAPGTARLRWVIQDLHFRLAQAMLDSNKPAEAQSTIEQGLAIGSEPTLARANLLALQGKIYEAQARPEQAAKSLHEALLINEALLERALEGQVEPGRQ